MWAPKVGEWLYVNVSRPGNVVPCKSRVVRIIDSRYFVATLDNHHHNRYTVADVLGLCDWDDPVFPSPERARARPIEEGI
jgi:hypothetical protein